MENQTMFTIDDIKRRHKGFWFTPDTMRFFSSRVLPDVFPVEDGGALFISSERYDEESPRKYSVRKCDGVSGYIDTVGEFMGHATIVQARNHAKVHASRPDECPYCSAS